MAMPSICFRGTLPPHNFDMLRSDDHTVVVSKVTLDGPFDLRPETDPGLKCHGYRRLVLSLINVAK